MTTPVQTPYSENGGVMLEAAKVGRLGVVPGGAEADGALEEVRGTTERRRRRRQRRRWWSRRGR